MISIHLNNYEFHDGVLCYMIYILALLMKDYCYGCICFSCIFVGSSSDQQVTTLCLPALAMIC